MGNFRNKNKYLMDSNYKCRYKNLHINLHIDTGLSTFYVRTLYRNLISD